MKEHKQTSSGNGPQRGTPTVSCVFDDGTIIEMVHIANEHRTAFAVWQNGECQIEDRYVPDAGHTLVPYSANNNLIKHRVVLLPSGPEEYGNDAQLLADIRQFIHRYVDVSPLFETIACYYILLSWIYDGFEELPYLRLRGDYGTGKTRALLTIGSLCYKPMFASGASSTSSLFRIVDAFRGTLIMDESDFRFSDDKADMTKLLNNGNIQGFPILRTEMMNTKEFSPWSFEVFGPKIVAMRGYYEDRALESRFLTEDMGQRSLRHDIPISLTPEYREKALRLRNKLLLFRFRNAGKRGPIEDLVDRSIEPRLNQVFVPLLSVIDDPDERNELRTLARRYHSEIAADRSLDTEAQLLEVIRELVSAGTQRTVKVITESFISRYGQDYDRRISTKWIGWLIRKKLRLVTEKQHGVFVIPDTEQPKLDRLYERYGMSAEAAA